MRRLIALASAVLGALVAAPAAAPATARYVALGDSYTAGPLILTPRGDPIDCGRSDHNYPMLVANALRPQAFRDVSCGSAQTRDMTGPQTGLPLGGTNAPQFDALDDTVDLVTVGIGGNDMGFAGIVSMCTALAVQSLGMGRPCTDHYTTAGVNTVVQRVNEVVGPRLTAVLDGIHLRSPRARVVVVGDPDPVPDLPGCFPVVPFAPGDLPFLHELAEALHTMKQARAADAGADYVELLSGSAGHDICQRPGTKWYEGIVPTAPAYPVHPNVLGMEFAARQVLDVLGRPVPNDFAVTRRRGARTGAIALRLRAPSRGAFTVAAIGRTLRRPGLRTTRVRYTTASAFAARAGDVPVALRARKATRAALRRHGRAKVTLTVIFTPVAGEAISRRSGVMVGSRR